MKTLFYHVTHKRNLRSIMKHGLQLQYATQKRVSWIWLDVEPNDSIKNHVANFHGWKPEDCVTLVVEFRSDFCSLHPHDSTFTGYAYKTKRDIPAAQISLYTEQTQERQAA